MENFAELLKKSFFSAPGKCKDPSDPLEWARLCMYVTGQLLPRIRKKRYDIELMRVGSKEDGSPFTQLEHDIEDFCRQELQKFYSQAVLLGEESSSTIDVADDLYLFVIDPIDGTRAFLSNFDTFSMTITVIKSKTPKFSLVANPATGDIAFRIGNGESHIITLATPGSTLDIHKLPLVKPANSGPLLVNIHPALSSKSYIEGLYDLWKKGSVSLVKSVSGSPSWQIIEASKGTSAYLNTWKGGITMPFDLVAAFHILEGSGGIAYNLQGGLADPWTNEGPFLAGSNIQELKVLLELIAIE